MEMIHCPNCDRRTGHKRAFGWGTFFAAVITAGLWIFVLPFYPMRCIVCGERKRFFATVRPRATNIETRPAEWSSRNKDEQENIYPQNIHPQRWYKKGWVILLIFLAVIVTLNLLGHFGGHEEQTIRNVDAQHETNTAGSASILRQIEDAKQTPKQEEQSVSELSSLTADQLISSCIVNFDAAIKMGKYADEYINNIEYMNKVIAVKGRVLGVKRDNSGDAVSYISFECGPCLAEGGNSIRCYPQKNDRNAFANIQPGQSITVMGRFYSYGRLPMSKEEELPGCGYYVTLKECKIPD